MSETDYAIEYAAEKLSVTLPVPQDEIKDTVSKLLVTLANIHKAQLTTKRLLEAVRDCRDHNETISTNHMGRWPATQCTICGKEW